MLHFAQFDRFIIELKDSIEKEVFDFSLLSAIEQVIAECDDKQEREQRIALINAFVLDNKQLSSINTIILYSLMIKYTDDEKYMISMAEYILDRDDLSWQTLYFLYQRLALQTFFNPNLNTTRINKLQWDILHKAFHQFKKNTTLDLSPIDEMELNGATALLITDQFLTDTHGPTKTTLDRAYVLKKMFRNVLIINTAECLTKVGKIPCFIGYNVGYEEELLEKETVEWKGQTFGYFQCEPDMPNEDTMGVLLEVIRKLRPQVCVCVGGDSFFAGVVNELIPTIVVGTTQSNLMKSLCDYQIADSYQIELDKELIREMDYAKHIICGRFTFALKDSVYTYARDELGVGEDAFVIAMVGGRLDIEITDELWEELSKLYDENIVILTIGKFGKEESTMKKYGDKIRVRDLGLCEDVIALLKLADLYVNPLRKGGATSAVEALSVGVPVLTVNYGDVAGTVGEEYWCESLSEYSDIIKRYIRDKEFYEEQSRLARKKAKVLMDSETVFREVIEEYMRRRRHF